MVRRGGGRGYGQESGRRRLWLGYGEVKLTQFTSVGSKEDQNRLAHCASHEREMMFTAKSNNQSGESPFSQSVEIGSTNHRHNKEQMLQWLAGHKKCGRHLGPVILLLRSSRRQDARALCTYPCSNRRTIANRARAGIRFQEETQFGINNHHSDSLSLVVSVIHHIAKLASLELQKGSMRKNIYKTVLFQGF